MHQTFSFPSTFLEKNFELPMNSVLLLIKAIYIYKGNLYFKNLTQQQELNTDCEKNANDI